MSYVCLFASKNGAVVAADTRITYHGVFPFVHRYHNHGVKVFRSKDGRTIWTTSGLTSRTFLNVQKEAARVMDQSEVPFPERLQLLEDSMCKATKPSIFTKLFRRIPAYEKDCPYYLTNIIYYNLSPEGVPSAGALCFKDGEVFDRQVYRLPVFSQNGKNMHQLSPAIHYHPKADASVFQLYSLATRRVQEAIDKDTALKSEDRSYRATVGGRILTKSVSALHLTDS